MDKRITIDVSQIIYKLWHKYDGDLSQLKWGRSKEHNIKGIIINLITDKINTLEDLYQFDSSETTISYKFDFKNRELKVIFKWNETINLYTWINAVNEDLRSINNIIWSNGLTSYYSSI